MPLGLENSLKNKKWSSRVARNIVMTKFASKFAGFLANTAWTSRLLAKSSKIPRNLRETFANEGYKTLNEAFTHRYSRTLFTADFEQKFPGKSREKIMISPADGYLNIREIKNGRIELYPEIVLDLEKMIGAENVQIFADGGKFFLFTLKPHHDHTVDYPLDSQVLSKPEEISRENSRIFSTDLNFARFLGQEEGIMVFQENHRVLTKLLATAYDEPYFMLEIGATNVNSIVQDNCQVGETYSRGTQKSHFNFGSTVALLLPQSFAQKIEVLPIFSQDFYTSVEVQRRDVLAVGKDS